MGFKGGRRIREGTVFFVENHEKSKWFIDYPETEAPTTDKSDKKADINDLI